MNQSVKFNDRVRRKLMILKYRLEVAESKNDLINDYTISISGTSPKFWQLQSQNSQDSFDLIPSDNLTAYTEQGRNMQHSEKNEYNIFHIEQGVLKLFPEIKEAHHIEHPLTDSNLGVFSFGQYLGLEKNEVRFIIDEIYATKYPMFRAMSQTKPSAEKFCHQYSGLYRLYRHDLTLINPEKYPKGFLLSGSIAIRYPITHKPFDSDSQGKKDIRVKLVIPSYSLDNDIEYYKYDGLLGYDGKWWSWLFQGRFHTEDSIKHSEDIILLYTESPSSHRDDGIYFGKMLTQNQDEATPTASDIILIKEIPGQLIEKEGLNGSKYYVNDIEGDESTLMKEKTKLVDLNKPETWTENDKIAMRELFISQIKRNLR